MLGWVLPSPAWATTGISTPCLVGDRGDRVEQVGQQRHGRADVLEQQRPATLQRRERRPPGLHEQLALVGVVGDEHLRALRLAGRLHDGHLLAARGARCVGLGDQQRAGLAVQPHRLVVLDGVDRRPVHQLEHRGPHHRAHAPRRRRQPGATDREGGDERRPGGLGRHEPQDRAGDDAEGALAADEELEQRQPGDVLDPLAAERDEGAVGEHDVEAEHVVGRDAVLHAAQPAGVGRHVAADRADLERRRVGRVPEPVLGGRRASRRR